MSKILIVAKTRQGRGACIGGITFEGRSVRLIAANAETDEQAGMEYEVGEVWEVETSPMAEITPPHVENVIVRSKRRLAPMTEPETFIQQHMAPETDGIDVLFDGLTQATTLGALYIAERNGVPDYSTLFWRPDQPLQRDDDSKRIRYRYPSDDGGRTLTFVGFQAPVDVIPAGTLLRVSLAQWWRPPEMPKGELRCYVQLSGWFWGATTQAETAAASAPTPEKEPPPIAIEATMRHARQLLKDVFGYDDFMSLQAEIITNVLQRNDSLVIMPTGGGKSLCYQLPALLADGLTVVVSPLIALMQDQVDALRQLGVAAAFLNSTLSMGEYVATVGRIKRGEIKLLYVAPETLLRPETLVMLDQSRVQLFAIDEAHCISSWGHDFRPEYRQLLSVRQRYSRAVCLALTATATPRVQQDIENMLGFDASNRFVASFDRKNLHLDVRPRLDGLRQTIEFLEAHREQSGIIYCTTRKQVDELAAQLQARGWSALPYHAGLESEIRQQHQRQFVHDEAAIIVATVAFGMGIDKSNVRFILHFNLPGNIERYYQEIGRAGRDGLRADCRLLFSQGDVGNIYYFIDQGSESERPGRQVRLQAMVRYAQSDECRRRPLLAYLGETYEPENCGMCDNCLAEKQERVMEDVTIETQKFLSCVKRTGEIFGVTHIIKVLRGSRDQAVLNRRHDQLSTYGIGQEISTREWKRLAQAFIQQKLVEQDMQYGGLRLTPKAYDVFRGEVVLVVAEEKTPGPGPTSDLDYDALLFEALRVLRKQVADEAQVPPYVIFSDRSLIEMATYFPQSDSAFLATYGVAQRKLAAHGERFMALIRDYCAEHDLKERPRPGSLSSTTRSGSTKKRRYQEVGELFASGYELEELQNLYKVKLSTIISHLSRYQQTGGDVDAERVLVASNLPSEQQEQVLALLDELGYERLGPIYTALDGKVSYDELRLIRLYYVSVNQ